MLIVNSAIIAKVWVHLTYPNTTLCMRVSSHRQRIRAQSVNFLTFALLSSARVMWFIRPHVHCFLFLLLPVRWCLGFLYSSSVNWSLDWADWDWVAGDWIDWHISSTISCILYRLSLSLLSIWLHHSMISLSCKFITITKVLSIVQSTLSSLQDFWYCLFIPIKRFLIV